MEDIDVTKLNSAILDVDEISNYVGPIINDMVEYYSSDLDKLMDEIQQNVISVENPSSKVIEAYFLKLSGYLYNVMPNMERLGIYDSISKLNLKGQYNTSYIDNDVVDQSGKKPTATKLTSLAENESQYESLLNEAYNKAYKIVRAKVEAAQTLVATLSKIMSSRMSEVQLGMKTVDGRTILNETL